MNAPAIERVNSRPGMRRRELMSGFLLHRTVDRYANKDRSDPYGPDRFLCLFRWASPLDWGLAYGPC